MLYTIISLPQKSFAWQPDLNLSLGYLVQGCDSSGCAVIDEGVSNLGTPQSDLSEFTYVLKGCDDKGCVVLSEGNAQNLIEEAGDLPDIGLFANGRNKKGVGKKSFHEILAEWTGNLVEAITDFLEHFQIKLWKQVFTR